MADSITPPVAGLHLVGAVAKLLNAGLGPDETLAAVADLLRERLQADSVAIWLRESHATRFRAITSPRGLAAPRSSGAMSEVMEKRPSNSLRAELVHEGERLGLVEAKLPGGLLPDGDDVLAVIADILAPFLASIELSEDLAYEVALRSREVDDQRRFISLVIDSLPVGLYVIDREYRIQVWNRKRETGTQGLRREEVVGRTVFDVLPRQPAEQLRAEFDQVFATGEIHQVELDAPVAGEERSFRITKIPMRLDGEAISHVITIGEDLTEWHEIQQRILQSDKLAAIGQLAAGVMHEINNPLATINACVEAVEGRLDEVPEGVGGAIREYIEIIEKEVQRCSRIVDGLLDFSRSKPKAQREVNLSGLVEDTLFLLKHHQRFKRLTVHRGLSDDLPPVLANAEQLIQAFMALMLNALDAMEGEGALTVRTRRNPDRDDEVIAEFEDTGAGIPRAELPKIFEPFYTTKPQGRGTGLGLSICYGIVEQHRGRIEVESTPGIGAVFRVYLPVRGETAP